MKCRVASVDALVPDEGAFDAVFAVLPDWRRRKVQSLRFYDDRRRSVAVWLLLRRMMAEMGIAADALDVEENEFGRPRFVALPDVHFSLSHAADRVMAAVANSPVGCDLERIEPFEDRMAEACLASDELAAVMAKPKGPLRDREFCRLWVRKESYAKARGLGLSLDFKSFSVLSGDMLSDREFCELDLGDGYLGCLDTLPQV